MYLLSLLLSHSKPHLSPFPLVKKHQSSGHLVAVGKAHQLIKTSLKQACKRLGLKSAALASLQSACSGKGRTTSLLHLLPTVQNDAKCDVHQVRIAPYRLPP